MENIQVAIAILCVIAIVLLVVFAFCNAFEFLTWIAAWIRSTTEEKIGLTRAKGHYNANGYLVSVNTQYKSNFLLRNLK